MSLIFMSRFHPFMIYAVPNLSALELYYSMFSGLIYKLVCWPV